MKLLNGLLVVIVGGLACSGLSAQLPGMDIPSGASVDYMPVIFLNPKVAQDMHLSPAVAQKETSLIMQMGMSMIGQNADTNASAKHKAAGMIAAFQKLEDESLAPLNQMQRARYRQLTLQFIGPPALVTPSVATKLGLTAAQKSKLSTVMETSMKAMAKGVSGMKSSASSDPMGTLHSVRAAQSTARAIQEHAAHSILSTAQRAKWQDMQGKKIPGIEDLLGSMGG
jgi:hypothetical protein